MSKILEIMLRYTSKTYDKKAINLLLTLKIDTTARKIILVIKIYLHSVIYCKNIHLEKDC